MILTQKFVIFARKEVFINVKNGFRKKISFLSKFRMRI